MARLMVALLLTLALAGSAVAAEVTVIVAQFQNGLVRVEVDYDDANLRVSRVRVVNDSDAAAHVTAVRLSDGLSYSQRFSARSTTFRNIPTGQADRLQFTLNDGRLDGISFEILWPYP